jgi:hypothetical protein
MSSDRTLWFTIEGDPVPFKLIVKASIDVNDLREVIWKVGIDDNTKHGVLAKNLTLWKVRSITIHPVHKRRS